MSFQNSLGIGIEKLVVISTRCMYVLAKIFSEGRKCCCYGTVKRHLNGGSLLSVFIVIQYLGSEVNGIGISSFSAFHHKCFFVGKFLEEGYYFKLQ